MDANRLKRFAQSARRSLLEQVGAQLKRVLAPDSAARREYPEAVRKLEERLGGKSGELGVDSGELGVGSGKWAGRKDQGSVDPLSLIAEEVAYTWFNRFCALRFMDLRGYNRVRVASPLEGQFQPEILAEAKMGHIDEEIAPEKIRRRVFGLLEGSLLSPDPQGEAYRLLIVAACNAYHRVMPYLFERIEDYTELLLPADLLSENSILAVIREALTPENCEDVEVVGWLYQFYISERKDEVFAALKKNQKITPENIPAATQLFTPHWIVRYLVENSLGRLWMLNRPESKLVDRMEYYVGSEGVESGEWVVGSGEQLELGIHSLQSRVTSGFLKVGAPEEIKVCDPACGSGHMLTYAFDLLYAIYEEEGYDPSQIPGLILTHNLYGIEIDRRAGTLAAFALTMKAREKQRRFFRKPIQPNICVLEKITFAEGELAAYMDFVGRDLFTAPLIELLNQFKEADNFGSLIRPVVTDARDILNLLSERNVAGELLLYKTHEKVLRALEQADYLSPRYQVVVANPPYMGVKGMNARLSAWVKDNYPSSKSDLFAVFVERILDLVTPKGVLGFMTPFTWMFLSSYEKLRLLILNQNTLTSLVRPEYHAFFDSAYVPLCAFTLDRNHNPNYKGAFIDLQNFYGAGLQPVKTLEAIANPQCGWFYRASANDFQKIPGSAIAYWVSQKVLDIFAKSNRLESIAEPRQGLATADNDRFLRLWFEVSDNRVGFGMSNRKEAKESQKRWFPYNKGGDFRKWYGNQEYLVNWENDGKEIDYFKPRSVVRNPSYYFQESASWSKITSGGFSLRLFPNGFIFDVAGTSIFSNNKIILRAILGAMNSPIMLSTVSAISPTLNYEVGQIKSFPVNDQVIKLDENKIQIIEKIIDTSRLDWNSYETSWDFTQLPLISHQSSVNSEQTMTTFPISKPLSQQYQSLRRRWAEMTQEMQKLEEENNRIFIEAYGLQDELGAEVPLNEITLTCNPYYRYGVKEVGSGEWKVDSEKLEVGSGEWKVGSEKQILPTTHSKLPTQPQPTTHSKLPTPFPYNPELEQKLLTDTIKELISYAVGCMFGRYSLDKPGLILANQGETIDDYFEKVCHDEKVDSDESIVDSVEGNYDNSSQLQRVNRLAESHGFSNTSLSSNEAVSQGRTLRTDESSSTISRFDSIQHSRGSVQKIDSGISEFLVHCQRFKSGNGDPNPTCPALKLCNQRYSARNTESLRGSQSTTTRTHEKPQIDHSPLPTPNSPLSTPHSQLPTAPSPLPTTHSQLPTTHCPLSTIHFLPDPDNVIPILDGDWFADDITEQFRKFLRISFGQDNYQENLNFIEQALGKDIRKYFLKDFYTDHIKRYKKRPIYWLFSSANGSFNALIYLHRYRPDTVSVVLNDYLRELRAKLVGRKENLEQVSIATSAGAAEKTKALKESETLKKTIEELDSYERDILYPLAAQRLDIDLDDGVKVNYLKFGKALKKIPGLETKGD